MILRRQRKRISRERAGKKQRISSELLTERARRRIFSTVKHAHHIEINKDAARLFRVIERAARGISIPEHESHTDAKTARMPMLFPPLRPVIANPMYSVTLMTTAINAIETRRL
ncbi:hypothetical protein RRG08_025037 [Elysia crispata]|uniref:Uncharacterized protein n=1 Tax=Elysia crispata TaxID=231223 RepID=A0AAE1ANX2_9GAST|nr:hypothetical protein RRG08_025037 [Elysia crispata]